MNLIIHILIVIACLSRFLVCDSMQDFCHSYEQNSQRIDSTFQLGWYRKGDPIHTYLIIGHKYWEVTANWKSDKSDDKTMALKLKLNAISAENQWFDSKYSTGFAVRHNSTKAYLFVFNQMVTTYSYGLLNPSTNTIDWQVMYDNTDDIQTIGSQYFKHSETRIKFENQFKPIANFKVHDMPDVMCFVGQQSATDKPFLLRYRCYQFSNVSNGLKAKEYTRETGEQYPKGFASYTKETGKKVQFIEQSTSQYELIGMFGPWFNTHYGLLFKEGVTISYCITSPNYTQCEQPKTALITCSDSSRLFGGNVNILKGGDNTGVYVSLVIGILIVIMIVASLVVYGVIRIKSDNKSQKVPDNINTTKSIKSLSDLDVKPKSSKSPAIKQIPIVSQK